jgi:GxxExxY protein
MNTLDIESIGKQIVDSAIKVHREMGPGLLESVYETCLQHELTKRSLKVERQKIQPVHCDGIQIDDGYRIDLLVEGKVIIELKAIDTIHPIHHSQTLTYMRLSGCTLGYLINFNVILLKQGLHRKVQNHPS